MSSCDQPRPPSALGFPSESHLPGPDAPGGCPFGTGLFSLESDESPSFPSGFLQPVSILDELHPTQVLALLAAASSPPDQVSSRGGPPGAFSSSTRLPLPTGGLSVNRCPSGSPGCRFHPPWCRERTLEITPPGGIFTRIGSRGLSSSFLFPSEPCPCAPQKTSPPHSRWDPRSPLLVKKASDNLPPLSRGRRWPAPVSPFPPL